MSFYIIYKLTIPSPKITREIKTIVKKLFCLVYEQTTHKHYNENSTLIDL